MEVDDLGLFGAMALLAVLQAGADPGYRQLRHLRARGLRLAPHRALRQQILFALLEAGAIAPVAERRLRLDATLADPAWEEDRLEDADWRVLWNDVTRSALPARLQDYLDQAELTPHNEEVLLDAWIALGTAECLAFGEYALSAHRMNPAIALVVAPVLGPVLAQSSIGQACALMWWGAKNVASSFLRHGGQPGLAEREMVRSVTNAYGRASTEGRRGMVQFQRHSSIPESTFAAAFLIASRLGAGYWTLPISASALKATRS